MSFTKKQAIEAKYYLQRTGECALLAYHSDEGWISLFWLKEADEAFKKAATALGYLIEPITDNEIAAAPEAKPEAVVVGTAPATASDFPTSSSHRGFAVEGQ